MFPIIDGVSVPAVDNNDKSTFRLLWQDCGNAVKSVLYVAKWGIFLHL